jgi:hypothetical protein
MKAKIKKISLKKRTVQILLPGNGQQIYGGTQFFTKPVVTCKMPCVVTTGCGV